MATPESEQCSDQEPLREDKDQWHHAPNWQAHGVPEPNQTKRQPVETIEDGKQCANRNGDTEYEEKCGHTNAYQSVEIHKES